MVKKNPDPRKIAVTGAVYIWNIRRIGPDLRDNIATEVEQAAHVQPPNFLNFRRKTAQANVGYS